MPTSSRRPLTVTARITVEIENAADWSNLLRTSMVEVFKAAAPAPRPAPVVRPSAQRRAESGCDIGSGAQADSHRRAGYTGRRARRRGAFPGPTLGDAR